MPDNLGLLTPGVSEFNSPPRTASRCNRRSADHVLLLDPDLFKPSSEPSQLRQSAPPKLWTPDSPSSYEHRFSDDYDDSDDERDPLLALEDAVFETLEQELTQRALKRPDIEQEMKDKITSSVPRPFEEIKPLSVNFKPQSHNSYQAILRQKPQKILHVQFGKPRGLLSKDSLLSEDSLLDNPEFTNNPFKDSLYLGAQTDSQSGTQTNLSPELLGFDAQSKVNLTVEPGRRLCNETESEARSTFGAMLQSKWARPEVAPTGTEGQTYKQAKGRPHEGLDQSCFESSYILPTQSGNFSGDFWDCPELTDAKESISSILIEEEIIERYSRGFYDDVVPGIPEEDSEVEASKEETLAYKAEKGAELVTAPKQSKSFENTLPPPRPERPRSPHGLDHKAQENYKIVQHDLCRTIKERAANLRPLKSSVSPKATSSASAKPDKTPANWRTADPVITPELKVEPRQMLQIPRQEPGARAISSLAISEPRSQSKAVQKPTQSNSAPNDTAQSDDEEQPLEVLQRLSTGEDLFVCYDSDAKFPWTGDGTVLFYDKHVPTQEVADVPEIFEPRSLAEHIEKVNHPETTIEIQQALQIPLTSRPKEIVLGPLPESRHTRVSTTAHISNRDLLKSVTRTSVGSFGLKPVKVRDSKHCSSPAKVRCDALQKAQEEDPDWFDWESPGCFGNSNGLKGSASGSSPMEVSSIAESKQRYTQLLLRQNNGYDFLPSPKTASSTITKETILERTSQPPLLSPALDDETKPAPKQGQDSEVEQEPTDSSKSRKKSKMESSTGKEQKQEQPHKTKLVRRSILVCQQLGHQIGDIGDHISRKFRKNRHPSQTAEAIALRHISKRRKNRGHDLAPVLTLASIISV